MVDSVTDLASKLVDEYAAFDARMILSEDEIAIVQLAAVSVFRRLVKPICLILVSASTLERQLTAENGISAFSGDLDMTAIHRFHLYVATMTVSVMYLTLVHLLPRFSSAENPSIYYRLPLAFLGSVASYQLLAKTLLMLFNGSLLVRKLILGPEFVEGTWIGYYTDSKGDRKFTVERFEQTLDRIIIRGAAKRDNDQEAVQWESLDVSVDPVNGQLIYMYNCDPHSAKSRHQGIAVFQFERKGPGKPPHILYGYSADLIDGVRSTNRERKMSDRYVEFSVALKEAKNLP